MSEKTDTRFMGGEDALEIIQEDLKEEIDALIGELIEKVKAISKDREDYDLTDFAMDHLLEEITMEYLKV